jgi:hypothetical protein
MVNDRSVMSEGQARLSDKAQAVGFSVNDPAYEDGRDNLRSTVEKYGFKLR